MTHDKDICHSDVDSKREKLRKLISKAPKPQLHLHLDGSLSCDFIMKAAKRLKENNKDKVLFEHNWEPENEESLVRWFMNTAKVQQKNNSKADDNGNWKVFDVCNQFLQTEEDLNDATFDLTKRMCIDHAVNYIEIRFAPFLHTQEGLSEREAVLAVIEGFLKAKRFLSNDGYNISGGIILCALRSFSVSEAIKVVKLIKSLDNENVVGFDIAGDEASYPLHLFSEALHLAKEEKINITVHAGEWNENKNKNIMENLKLAIELGVNRIGHGLALRSFDKNSDILVQMKAKNISVEVCLTSNCDNPEKCADFSSHPLPSFLKNKLAIAGLNVDNLMLAGDHQTGLPDPSGEIARAIIDCGVQGDDLLTIIESSYKAAFKAVPNNVIADSLKVWKEDIIPHIDFE